MKILSLDTAMAACSVAVIDTGSALPLAAAFVPMERGHAEALPPMVAGVMTEAGLDFSQIDRIAVTTGPGTFTGVRIAASVTQGLAFAADLPVLPVSDLRALALQAAGLETTAGLSLLACMDARMHEVYWSLHPPTENGAVADAPEQVTAPSVLLQFLVEQAHSGAQCLAAGCGLAAYFGDDLAFGVPVQRQLPRAEPHAREIARLALADYAAGLALPAEAAIPVYVRDQVVQTPRT